MNGTRNDLPDITAYPAYQKLTQGLTRLPYQLFAV